MLTMNGIDISPLESLWGKKAETQGADTRGKHSKTIFREVFNFYERHAGKEKDWDAICEEMDSLSRKLDSHFADALLIAVKEELEREAGLF